MAVTGAVVDLFPGEDPRSYDSEDVEHWIGVYEELLDFCLRASSDGETGLEPYIARFRERLEYWRDRQLVLT